MCLWSGLLWCLGLVSRYYWPCEMSWRVFPLIFWMSLWTIATISSSNVGWNSPRMPPRLSLQDYFLLLINSFIHLGLIRCSFLLESVMVICIFLQICPLHLSCLNTYKKWKWKSLCLVWLFATPWTIQSMKFSRQGHWSELPFPSPGDLPTQGSNPGLPHCRRILCHLRVSHTAGGFFAIWATREALKYI